MSVVFYYGLLQSFDRTLRVSSSRMVSRQFRVCSCFCSEVDRNDINNFKEEQVPKLALNNISMKIKSRLKVEMSPQYKDSLVTDTWHSSLTIKWPDCIMVVGKGTSKIQAQHAAAQSALKVLKQNNVIDDYGNLLPSGEVLSNYAESVVGRKVAENRPAPTTEETYQRKVVQDEDINQFQNSKTAINKAVLEMIARRFPKPKGTLHNVYAEVARCLKNDAYCAVPSYQLVRDTWQCSYRLRWPSQTTFFGEGRNKSQATHVAALFALHWLTVEGRLLKDGTVCLERRMEIPPPPLVAVPLEFKNPLNTLHSRFQSIKDVVHESTEGYKEVLQDTESKESESNNSMSSFTFNNRSEREFMIRNSELQRKHRRRLDVEKIPAELPIHQFREQLLKLVGDNRVLIIKGEPGCGKSTQVPQFIFDQRTQEGYGSQCSIIITEPRRIAAISLSERVAEERGEQVGDVVGYQVRLQSRLPQGPGGILYMSSGMLLRHLQRNPLLNGVTHVVLDEAHERDTNVDILVVLLRHALARNPELRLIVMSATIDAALFKKYFNAPLMEVPGFTFPVVEHYLDDLVSQGTVEKFPCNSTVPYINVDLVCQVIDLIHQNRPEGAMLCFMPGWAEIKAVMDKLNMLMNKNDALVVPIHSRIPYADQKKIFSKPPPGVRKIILATNIAETSITVNDVKYVVDTGLHREQRLNSNSGTSSIGNRWISKVNVKQRRGRAGRLQPGESFHLFSRQHFETMDNFPIPEILRVPLEKTILDCKAFTKDQKAVEFLSQLPEPPSAEAVELGVSELIHIGVLDHDENLTALGKRIMHFPTHPKLSKAMINAVILRCTQPVLTISTILGGEVDIFRGALTEKDHIREVKREYHPTSDHISLWRIHNMLQRKRTNIKSLCRSMDINASSIDSISRLNRLFSDYLYQSKILPYFENLEDDVSDCNRYQLHDEIVKAVLMSGLGNILIKRNWKIINGRLVKDSNLTVTEQDQQATVTSESVNYKQNNHSSPYFTHFKDVKSLERRSLVIRESSLVSAMCVILFKPGELTVEQYEAHSAYNSTVNNRNYVVLSLKSKGTVKMLCEKGDAEQLLQLRNIIWWILDYYINNEGILNMDHNHLVDEFREHLLKLLVELLSYKIENN